MKEVLQNNRKPLAAITIAVSLVTGIKVHESYRDSAYYPVKGDVPTIGYGTTRYPDGSSVKIGDKVTRKQAEELLANDIEGFRKAMIACIKVPLTVNEAEAYTSLTYNIGSSAFCKSTLVKKLNSYDYEGACKEILKWNMFQGKPLKGLTIRREEEYRICIKQE